MKIIRTNIQDNLPLVAGVELFEKHRKDDKFLRMVRNVKTFNHTDHNGYQVAHVLTILKGEVRVTHYTPAWRFSRAIARTVLEYQTLMGRILRRAPIKLLVPEIQFNVYVSQSALSNAETLMHECLHVIGYTHDGNYVTNYNLGTVPYRVAAIFLGYLKELYPWEEV